MFEYEADIIHLCGHTEHHKWGSSEIEPNDPNDSWMRNYFAKRKCSHCRPICPFCHRSGNRESMLVTESGVYCSSWCLNQSKHQTRYAEHNEIAIPNRLRHWRDDSWHNDLCARSAYELGNGDELCIWVNPEDPEERETPDMGRFMVVFCPGGELDPDVDQFYEGNNEAEMELWAHAAEIVRCGADADDDAAAMPKVKAIQAMMATTPKEEK